MQETVITPDEKKNLWYVITASSVGTLIEWYDFYIFGSLAIILSQQFFPDTNPTAAFLATLGTFGAGFVVRPFGAIVFGRLGDIVGRKYTFLVTLILMGGMFLAYRRRQQKVQMVLRMPCWPARTYSGPRPCVTGNRSPRERGPRVPPRTDGRARRAASHR